MPKSTKAQGETTEDLAAKGAQFDVETPEGSFTIIMPALDRDDEPDESDPQR